jgi:hypothetical protein
MSAFGQTDTIFTKKDTISCKIVKIKKDSISYSTTTNGSVQLISKKKVDKIVYKNGKTVSIKEELSLKHIAGVSEYNDVQITYNDSDITNYTKIIEVSTEYSAANNGQSKSLNKAYSLLKLQAALLGANIIYIPEQNALDPNKVGDTTQTSITGIAYCDKLPTLKSFESAIADQTTFASTEQWYMHRGKPDVYQFHYSGKLIIDHIYEDNGIVYMEAELKSFPKVQKFRLVSLSNKSFMLYFEVGTTAYNVQVDL